MRPDEIEDIGEIKDDKLLEVLTDIFAQWSCRRRGPFRIKSGKIDIEVKPSEEDKFWSHVSYMGGGGVWERVFEFRREDWKVAAELSWHVMHMVRGSFLAWMRAKDYTRGMPIPCYKKLGDHMKKAANLRLLLSTFPDTRSRLPESDSTSQKEDSSSG
jgi:hypothetical protein